MTPAQHDDPLMRRKGQYYFMLEIEMYAAIDLTTKMKAMRFGSVVQSPLKDTEAGGGFFDEVDPDGA